MRLPSRKRSREFASSSRLVRALKQALTSIGTSAREVHAGLDRLRDGILARLAEAEAELRN